MDKLMVARVAKALHHVMQQDGVSQGLPLEAENKHYQKHINDLAEAAIEAVNSCKDLDDETFRVGGKPLRDNEGRITGWDGDPLEHASSKTSID